MIDVTFARSEFIAAAERQNLCARLSQVLTARMQAARNIHMELEWIVADLRTIGHQVKHWDGVIANWDDPNEDPYLWISLDGVDLHDESAPIHAKVEVAFRPRIPQQIDFCCPLCGSEMREDEIRLQIQGHGSVNAPGLRVQFECPGLKRIDERIGVTSVDQHRAVRICTSCGAGLLLPTSR